MLLILNKDEKVVGILSNTGDSNKITQFYNDDLLMDLDTGAESLEFTIRADAPESPLLVIGNYVATSYKGITKLFTIVSLDEEHGETFDKTVYAESCGLELLNSFVRPVDHIGIDAESFVTSILQDTSFNLGVVDGVNVTQDVSINSYTSVYKLLQDIVIKQFGLEIVFRVEIINNRLVKKYIDIFYKRGTVTKHRFEYGENMSSVKRTEDSTELCTALIGVGTDGVTFKDLVEDDKPKGQDYYVNEDAYNRYNIRGRHIYGVFEYATDSPHELLLKTKEESKVRSVPKISYDLNVDLLGEGAELGDTVYIIDNTFKPALHLEARIKQLSISKSNPTANKCVLANFKEVQSGITDQMKAISDKLVVITGKFDGDVEALKDKIEAIQVGGRNMLLDSVRRVTNNSYPTAIFTLSQQEEYVAGAEYTMSIKGQLGAGKRSWSICKEGGTVELCTITEADKTPDGRYVKTFNWIKGADQLIEVYPKNSSTVVNSTIEWVKLEFGNVASDHSYAQEDLDQVVNDKINDTETILNQNINNSVNNATDKIMENVSNNYADKVTITEMQSNISSQIVQTNQSVELNFNRVNEYTAEVEGELNNYKNTVSTHIRFSENGMELGQKDSPFSATLDSKKLAFLEDNVEVAYISNNKMHITQAEISDSLKIGNKVNGFFSFLEGSNGNLSLKWSKA